METTSTRGATGSWTTRASTSITPWATRTTPASSGVRRSRGIGGYPPVSLGADGALDAAFSGLAHAAVDPLRKDKELRRSEWFFPPVSLLAEGLRSRNPPAAGHPRGTAREAARLSTGTQAYRRLGRPTRGGHRTWITSGRPLSTTPTR